jgi:hypothetical protein
MDGSEVENLFSFDIYRSSRFVGRAKLCLSRERGCPGILSKNLVPLDSWVKPRTSKLIN